MNETQYHFCAWAETEKEARNVLRKMFDKQDGNEFPVPTKVECTEHQLRVEEFMRLAGQELPAKPTMPSLEVRRLRATLILEETIETINALGFYIDTDLTLEEPSWPNLEQILDGCLDLSVVTIGTLSACGIKDKRPLELVDKNNLLKEWTGAELLTTYLDTSKGYKVDRLKNGNYRVTLNGKLIKPPSHKPPNLNDELERQSKLVD